MILNCEHAIIIIRCFFGKWPLILKYIAIKIILFLQLYMEYSVLVSFFSVINKLTKAK